MKNYLFILIGAIVAIYANAQEEQNIYILIAGIISLMYGVYRLQLTIPSKLDKEEESFVKFEEEE